MLWKTLIFLAATTVVLAGRVKKHQTSYEFHIKHDYDYGHHKKQEHQHHEKEEEERQEEPKQNEDEKEVEQQEDKKEEEQVQQEDKKEEEQQNEAEVSNIQSHKPEHYEESEYPAYEFLYKVDDHYTHDIKGHHEKKYGDEVKGAYWLLQPDGYKRTVKYEANKHKGFKANVDYSKIEEHDEKETAEGELNEKKDEEHPIPKSEYYVTIYHGLKKPTPIKEDINEEQEQDKQEESAQHIPIYVL